MKISLELVLLPLLFMVVAFFAISETALFSLRPWRLERLGLHRPEASRLIARLLADPLRLLVTFVIGAELSSIAAGNIMAMLRRDHFGGLGEAGVIAALAATTALLLLVGEITPKSVGASYPEWSAALIARPLTLAVRILAPISRPLAALASGFSGTARHRGNETLTETDFRFMVEMGMQEGELDRKEVEMIGAIFRLGDLPVRSVMVPRPDVSALPASSSVAEALAHIQARRHSRVPLFERDLDHITGVLYAKDLLGMTASGGDVKTIRDLARPAFFVPEAMRGRQLIREFQQKRLHLAVVVDEYGGTSGIVSLEDLLEEIVGDIDDDFDRPLLLHRQVRRGVDWVRGSFAFSEFKRKFRARARAGPYDTIGGYVLKLLGRVPSEGDRVSDGQFVYTVLRLERRRLLELMVERMEPEEKKGPGFPPGRRTG
jgi:putative hemolysin